MPNFKAYNQNQAMLLPANIRDWIAPDHVGLLINEVVDGLDLKTVEDSYSSEGRPGYHPAMLIKILFYAYSQGERSSRRIENLCQDNVVMRFLSANSLPDHGTISLFRKKHLNQLENIFCQIVLLCNELGLTSLNDISIDGSTFKANASLNNHFDKKALLKLKNKIKQILVEAGQTDEREDKQFGKQRGYNQLPADLTDKNTRQEKIKKLKTKLQNITEAINTIDQKQNNLTTTEDRNRKRNSTLNLTDCEACLMKMKNSHTHQPAYNGQIATNNQVILGYDIFDNGVDTNYLLPMIKKVENNTGVKPKIVKADSAYFSKDNIKYTKQAKINAFIPDREKDMQEKQASNNQIPTFDRRNFKYDKEQDYFICPTGKRLSSSYTNSQGKKQYLSRSCGDCQFKGQCTKGKNRQITKDAELELLIKEMRHKLNTKSGKKTYQSRMYCVEPSFSHLKSQLRADKFLCRGKPMVKTEFGLACIAHNLIKISNFLKKQQKNLNDYTLNTLTRLPTSS